MISFFIPGIPKPGGSKRAFVVKGRAIITDACKGNRDWKATVRDCASRAHSGPPLEGPLHLEITFCLLRPKGHFGAKGVKPSAPKYPAVKPDATKLLRSTEDALSGILWRDDSQVVVQKVSKEYADHAGAAVRVSVLGGTP